MKKFAAGFWFLNFTISFAVAQLNSATGTPKINNLVLPANYVCSDVGAVPQYIKVGTGAQALLLIPGLGFDKSIFDDFMKANRRRYTMYCITIPGYGNTQAPALPRDGTSFGDQIWNKSILAGIEKLIIQEQISRPIIVGHFVQGTQLALRMAMDFPHLVAGVVILGGPAKFILINEGKPVEYPLASSIGYIDKYTAPNWFGVISKNDYDAGNYLPEVYSLKGETADVLWKQSASVPLPVSVHALCEFLASDVTVEAEKVKCPVLVLRPAFSKDVLEKPVNNYLAPQFISSWEKVKAKNAFFQIVDIPGASTFLWKDNPKETYKQVRRFSNSISVSNR